MRSSRRERGFSTIELLTVLGIAGVIAALAVPSASRSLGGLRLEGDARALHNIVGLGKMRAATRFSKERIFVDLTTNSFYMQYWDKGTSKWITEGGSTTTSSGVAFGVSSVASAPPDTQSVFKQSGNCLSNAGLAIANTACVVFNSRGIPVDAAGAPTGETAFYLTDGVGVYAVTLSATPLIRLWWSPAYSAKWVQK